jgi:hypothetical protein
MSAGPPSATPKEDMTAACHSIDSLPKRQVSILEREAFFIHWRADGMGAACPGIPSEDRLDPMHDEALLQPMGGLQNTKVLNPLGPSGQSVAVRDPAADFIGSHDPTLPPVTDSLATSPLHFECMGVIVQCHAATWVAPEASLPLQDTSPGFAGPSSSPLSHQASGPHGSMVAGLEHLPDSGPATTMAPSAFAPRPATINGGRQQGDALTVPMSPTASQQAGPQQAIDRFLAEVCTVLPPTIIATPVPRRARCKLPATEDGLPRRRGDPLTRTLSRPTMISSALRLGLHIARRFGPSSRLIAPSCRLRRWTSSLEGCRSSLGHSLV